MIQAAQEPSISESLEPDYLVRMDNFEGPLDLLLHLIKQDEIEIWEVSIARITRQYVEYLELMEALNIEVASEFLLMAASLMRIKSQRLLPRPVVAGEDDDHPQTEEELIQRLLTYKLFKEAAAALQKRQEDAGPRFPRGHNPNLPDDFIYPLAEVDLFTLVKAIHEVEHRGRRREDIHAVKIEEIHLEDRVAFILSRLEETAGRVTFSRLLEPGSRRLMISVTFLAILELARQQVIQLLQDGPYEDIWIISKESAQVVAS
ncbi:MAG: segregation/condensation protein A [Candidatus Eisenbacteria sp.]|nr:segregation/condensation protein A [Candidatus Eisenbacteria bacterium]